jgi:hypothetical protein
MSNHTTLRALLVAVLLVGAAVAAPMAAVAQSQPDAQPAELAIQQESYISDDVQTSTNNGTQVYTIRGEAVSIAPQNFNTSDVVDFGLETDAGALSYDSAMGVYRFQPEGETGTFRVYWVTNEAVQTTQTVNNSTQTTTRIERVRYEAVLRVDGGTEMAHLSATEAADRQAAAEKWNEVTSRVDDELTVDQVAAAVQLRYNFASYLSGNFTGILAALVMTFGGWLVLAVYYGSVAWPIYQLQRKVNEFRDTEDVEGDLAHRQVELDKNRMERIFAAINYEDWFSDTDSAELRDIAETPKILWRKLIDGGPIAPEVTHQAYLQAMGLCDWTATVERDDTDAITDVTLHPPDDDVATDGAGETIDLTDTDAVEEIIPHVDASAFDTFDFVTAEFDDSDLDLELEDVTPESVLDEIDGWDTVADHRESAALLRDFIARVDEHPYTDDSGVPKTVQEVLNELLDLSYRARDNVGDPNAQLAVELLERAIENADPNERTRARVKEVRDGVSSD